MTPNLLWSQMRIPVIGAPMFIVSGPELVIEQFKAGIVGSFPALNARPKEALEEWLETIESELESARLAHPDRPIAPYAVNQIVHHSNDRLEHDVEVCIRHRVPIIITSLRAPDDVVPRIHEYGGLVFHDVISLRHAMRAIEAGVDGLILVCAGAGGHAGMLSPFALLPEVRRIFSGPIALSGSIATGASILAARVLGADFAYIGTRFIATTEARAPEAYKEMIVGSAAADIVYTPYFSGVHGNYIKKSILAAGFDADNLPVRDKAAMNFASSGSSTVKAWRDIWSAGQGAGQIDEILPTAAVVERLAREYGEARTRFA